MTDFIPTNTPGSHLIRMSGKEITTSVAMEPGAEYGPDCPDSFWVGVNGSLDDKETGCVYFSSITEMEEFRDQLTKYIEVHKAKQ